MKKLLSILSESTVSGAIASAPSATGKTAKRDSIFAVGEGEQQDMPDTSSSPSNFGLWKNSYSIGKEQRGKHGRKNTTLDRSNMYPQLAEGYKQVGQADIDDLARSRKSTERNAGLNEPDESPISFDGNKYADLGTWHFKYDDGSVVMKDGRPLITASKSNAGDIVARARKAGHNIKIVAGAPENKLRETDNSPRKFPEDMADYTDDDWDAWDAMVSGIGKSASNHAKRQNSSNDDGAKGEKLDEISQKLKDRYVDRAVNAHGHYNMARRNTQGKDQEYWARKEKNTKKGISRALGGDKIDEKMTEGNSKNKSLPSSTPRNFVAKNAKTGGAGAHKDMKRAAKQGDTKHKSRQYEKVEESFGGRVDTPVSQAITRRIINQYPGLLKYGPDKVMAAIDQVSEWHEVGPDDEIGSSDVSAWVKEVARYLQTGAGEGIAESSEITEEMIADRLKTELDLFKKGSKAKDKELGSKPKSKDVQPKEKKAEPKKAEPKKATKKDDE